MAEIGTREVGGREGLDSTVGDEILAGADAGAKAGDGARAGEGAAEGPGIVTRGAIEESLRGPAPAPAAAAAAALDSAAFA